MKKKQKNGHDKLDNVTAAAAYGDDNDYGNNDAGGRQ